MKMSVMNSDSISLNYKELIPNYWVYDIFENLDVVIKIF